MSLFGRYTLIRRVGVGGMAEIWKAKVLGPAGFEKTVAVKKILPELTDDSEFLDMFIAEAKLVADLVHPNIVQVMDFGQVSARDYFIAMEYVSGANLGHLLKRMRDKGAHVPREIALLIVLEAAKGLGYAHLKKDNAGRALSIVHRDVSPSNVLLSYGGEVKVADFGIAKARTARQTTSQGFVRGKVSYMSPEQASASEMDHRSDIFSLGLLFYEVLTGKRYFTGDSSKEIYEKVLGFKALTDAELAPIDEDLRPILRKAMRADRTLRYQNAVELESALGQLLGVEGQMLARHGLSSILTTVFADEVALELTPAGGVAVPESDRAPAPVIPAGFQPAVSARGAGGGDLAVEGREATVVSRTPAEPSSHPTLAKPGVKVVEAETVIAKPPVEAAPDTSYGPKRATPDTASGPPPMRDTAIGPPPVRDTAVGPLPGRDTAVGPAPVRDTAVGPSPAAADTSVHTPAVALWKRPEAQIGALVIAAVGSLVIGFIAMSVVGANRTQETPTPFAAVSPTLPVMTPASSPVTSAVVDATAPVAVETLVVASPTPAVSATPVAVRTAVAVVHTPRKPPPTPAGMGTVSILARPWVEVWIDDKQISRDTPWSGKVPAGGHDLTFVHPPTKFRMTKHVVVPANDTVGFFVDVSAKTITPRAPR